MKQSEVFYQSEGDAWYERNKDVSREHDPVLAAMRYCKIKPMAVMEIGCGDGWRLARIQETYPEAYVTGLDASEKAMMNQKHLMGWGVAPADLEIFPDGRFDLVIFGFCLYVMDREDLFETVYRTDKILKDGGYLIIHDFYSKLPYSNAYVHKEGIRSYKMDYAALWLSHPYYSVVNREIFGTHGDALTTVVVLQKKVS
jgi:ubiquinone/menaquinone biosynthesis C-methylase UbiE